MNYYPKVRTVGHREISELFSDSHVVVQEKIDGSNFTFGKTLEGELFALSRSQKLNFSRPEKMFSPALSYVESISDRITPGNAFRCEYLRVPRHNVLAYSRIPTNHLVLFEWERQGVVTEEWQNLSDDRGALANWAWELTIDVVPEITRAKFESLEDFGQWITMWKFFEKDSYLGGVPIEGVVVKNFHRFSESGHPLIGKFVRPEFKEQMAQVKRDNGETPGKIEAIGLRCGGPARWQKAVQFLRDAGELQGGPEDIPALIKRVQQDVDAECQDEIKEALWKQFKGAVFKDCRQGLPEWYKSTLLP